MEAGDEKKKIVLLIGRDKDWRKLLQYKLRTIDCLIMGMHDGAQTLNELGGLRAPSAAIIDIDLSGEPNAVNLSEKLCERWPELRLIFTSDRVIAGPDNLPKESRFVCEPQENGDALLNVARELLKL